MIYEKVYAETLDIRDPGGFCADPEAYVASYLRQHFVGQCRKGALILQILEVIRRSSCRLKKTDLSGEGYVDVQFRASVSVLAQWDILTGVVVTRRAQIIVGESSSEGGAVAVLYQTPEAETVREGQTVAIRVIQARYGPGEQMATVVGPLLTCDKAAPVYQIAGKISAEDVQALKPLADRVKDLLAARAALIKTRRNDVFFFEELLYSYAPAASARRVATPVPTAGAETWEGPAGEPTPPGITPVNLLELAAEEGADMGGVWSRDLSFFRSSPLVGRAAGKFSGGVFPVHATPRTALASMLKTVHEFLKAVGEMVDLYDSKEIIDAHKNIWMVMRAAQLRAPQY